MIFYAKALRQFVWLCGCDGHIESHRKFAVNSPQVPHLFTRMTFFRNKFARNRYRIWKVNLSDFDILGRCQSITASTWIIRQQKKPTNWNVKSNRIKKNANTQMEITCDDKGRRAPKWIIVSLQFNRNAHFKREIMKMGRFGLRRHYIEDYLLFLNFVPFCNRFVLSK